jgi:tRNA(Ile2) C34 agmatinyltransferase TiaS
VIRYAVRAIPWGRTALAGALVVTLMELVRWNPWVLWPLEGTAVGLLAGAAAWCFDEPCAAVVDTLPRGAAWRTAARTPALVVLLATWTVLALHAGHDALFGHVRAVLVQGLAAMAGGAALAVSSRGRGEAMPGLRIATVAVPVATAWALVRPLQRALPVFPYGTSPTSAWHASTVGWLVVATVAALGAAHSLAETR